MRPFWIEQALFNDGDLAPALQGETRADVHRRRRLHRGLDGHPGEAAEPALDIVIVEADLCGATLTLRRLFGEAEAIRLVKASEAAVQHIADFCRAHARCRAAARRHAVHRDVACAGRHARRCSTRFRRAASTTTSRCRPPKSRAARVPPAISTASPIAATVHPGKLVAPRARDGHPDPRTHADARLHARATGGRAHAVRQRARGQARVRDQRVDGEPLPAVRAHDRGRVERHGHHREMPGAAREDRAVDGASVLDSRIFVYYYRRRAADARQGRQHVLVAQPHRARVRPALAVREAQLTQSLRAFFPSLAGVPVTASWNGPSDRSVTGFPFFGRFDDAPNVFYGFGYSGNGVGPAYMGGQRSCRRSCSASTTRGRAARSCAARWVISAGADPLCRRAHRACDPPQGARGGRNRPPAAVDVAREIRERGRKPTRRDRRVKCDGTRRAIGSPELPRRRFNCITRITRRAPQ